MCGIAGWISWEKDLTNEREIIERMTKILAHRGPDDSGIFLKKNAALGHRRLSVIDPLRGRQPMSRKGKNSFYTIIYNGELYNTNEIRNELLRKGYEFQTHSDTEVLLFAYIEWGSNCLEKLNGIYAFAVWNEKEKELFMARDRFGVKPLFYSELDKNQLIFGSELKALLSHPQVKPVLNYEGLAEVFVLGPSRTPGHGIYKKIKELRPGCFLKYNLQGLKISQYWKLISREHEDDLEITTRKVRDLVIDAVERQLVSDVPLCTFLSGGLDSSAITSIAVNYYKKKDLGKFLSYSIDYEDNDKFFHSGEFQPDSDNVWVDKVVNILKTNHQKVVLNTSELTESLFDAVKGRDLPGMADIDSSLYLFCSQVKKNVTVALSGECADEIFGGYPWYYKIDLMGLENFPWLRALDQKMMIFSPELREAVQYKKYSEKRFQETLDEVPILEGETPLERKRRAVFYMNFNWFMANLLERKDRMSMATGLEVRVPFCDHRIVEYAWNIPWEMKFYQQREKGLLRKALKGILPEEIIWRKKSPYPKTHNPDYTNKVKKILLDILEEPNSKIKDLLNIKYVRKILKNNEENFQVPWFGQLMTGPQLFAYLIQVHYWLKDYKVIIE